MPLLVKGVETLVAGLIQKDARALKAYRAAVRLEAERIMAQSQIEVPVDNGILKGSKFILQEDTTGGTRVRLGYRADYAVYVHEDLTANHPSLTNQKKGHAPDQVGKAKFLEDPLKAAVPGFDARVAAEVMKVLGG